MDTITQAVLGVGIAECGFRRRGGRAAWWLGVVGGTLPDADMLIGVIGRALGDPWLGWQYHRHVTHSIFFAPVAGLALAGVWNRYASYKNLPFWFLCASLVLLTHALLDWCTSYGTMLLAPFSNRRFALDAVPIIDPLYTGLLLAGILLCRWLRRHRPEAATWPAGLAGVILSTGYLGCGYIQHGRAMARLRVHAAAAGHEIIHARAIPSIGTIFLWRLVYRTPSAFYFARTNTLRPAAAEVFSAAPIPDTDAIRTAARDPRVKLLYWFADGMVLPEQQSISGGRLVRFQDVRYSWTAGGGEGLWGVLVALDAGGAVRDVVPYHRGLHKSTISPAAVADVADRSTAR